MILSAVLVMRHADLVQFGRIDAIVLDVVFPDICTVRDLGQDLASIGVGALLQNRLKARLDGFPTVPLNISTMRCAPMRQAAISPSISP